MVKSSCSNACSARILHRRGWLLESTKEYASSMLVVLSSSRVSLGGGQVEEITSKSPAESSEGPHEAHPMHGLCTCN